jgi:squalene synthase HpnC
MDAAAPTPPPSAHDLGSAPGTEPAMTVRGGAPPPRPDPLARVHGENFPVASRLLPARYRRHLLAVYGFARLVDDIGDEARPGDRTRLLDLVEQDLDRVYDPAGEPHLPVIRTLSATVHACDLPREWFTRLIDANRQDQHVTRYPTYEALRRYCDLSAAPVGRLVLAIFGVHDPTAARRSDDVCTALQLVEHWQDVAEDRRRGRVYLPAEDLAAYRVPDVDLDRDHASPALRRLILFETERAHTLLQAGAAVLTRLRGWARIAVAGYIAGGLATVDALRRSRGDVLAATPRPRRHDVARHLLRLLLRRTP